MKDVFQTLFAVAWADGELRTEERTFLADLVQRSEAGAEAAAWFTSAPPQPDWRALRSDEESAQAVLRQAMYMAAADETIQYEETLLLDRLREQLGLDREDFRRIQEEVEEAHS
jgi:tellurite resistance protein